MYAWLTDVPSVADENFHYVCREPIDSHPIKLNLLADVIGASAESDDDILMFLDGDAFPVGDVETLVREKTPLHKLVAVQRRENRTDIQPHPCFCATTIGFWRSIHGDWKEGYEWTDAYGERLTDVGGTLLKLLQERDVDWYTLLRSNKKDLHPLYFAVYGRVVYHHGAGFRTNWSRADIKATRLARAVYGFSRIPIVSRLKEYVPKEHRRSARNKVWRTTIDRNTSLAEDVYQKLVDDPHFYEELM